MLLCERTFRPVRDTRRIVVGFKNNQLYFSSPAVDGQNCLYAQIKASGHLSSPLFLVIY